MAMTSSQLAKHRIVLLVHEMGSTFWLWNWGCSCISLLFPHVSYVNLSFLLFSHFHKVVIYIYIYIYIMMNFVFELNHHHHHCCCFRYYVIIHFITSIYIWIFKTCEAFYWIVMDENFEVMTDMNFNFASIC
jgi:hypothetical protein